MKLIDNNERLAFYGAMLQRFFYLFRHVTYRNVQICKHFYFQFLGFINNRWGLLWAKKNLPYIQEMMDEIEVGTLFNLFDEPYNCTPNPNGVFLMRGGFGDIADLYLPKEKYYLLSPSRAEVDLIKLNRPDLVSHNIEDFYHHNPRAVQGIKNQIAHIVKEENNDPLFGGREFQSWLQSLTADLVTRFDAIQRIIEEQNIGATLTISSIHWFGSALNLVARANRIPSVTLQHGIIADTQLFCHLPILATKKAVWGEATKEWYQRLGTPESRLAVTGSPRFDIIYNKPWCGKEKLKGILKLNPAYKIAVYATQPLGGARIREAVTTVLNGLHSINNLFVLVLLHPNEKIELYQRLAAGYKRCQIIPFGQISLYDALSGADLFVTCFSTAAIEAMLFGTPVITVEPFPLNFSYGDINATFFARNSQQLTNLGERILNDQEFRAKAVEISQPFLSRFCVSDGSSSRRLINEVEDLTRLGGVF